MSSLICGSVAYDTIMTFEGHFREHILPDQIHMLNVSFLVPSMRREFGGCAGNIAYTLKLLGGDPVVMATVGVDAELGARVDGVVRETVRERLLPGDSELCLELCLGHRELLGFQQRRLGRDGVVVLIDELVLVDLRRGDVALGEDLNPLGGELGDDEVLHRAGVGVGLDEHEGRVHERRLGVGG